MKSDDNMQFMLDIMSVHHQIIQQKSGKSYFDQFLCQFFDQFFDPFFGPRNRRCYCWERFVKGPIFWSDFWPVFRPIFWSVFASVFGPIFRSIFCLTKSHFWAFKNRKEQFSFGKFSKSQIILLRKICKCTRKYKLKLKILVKFTIIIIFSNYYCKIREIYNNGNISLKCYALVVLCSFSFLACQLFSLSKCLCILNFTFYLPLCGINPGLIPD